MYVLTWPDNLWQEVTKNCDAPSNDAEMGASVLFYPNLDEVLSKALNERQQDILRQRYEQGMTYAEIAADYGVGAERIRQIIQRSLRTLREPKYFNMLKAAPMIEVIKLRVDLDDLTQKYRYLEQQYADQFGELEKKKVHDRLQIPLASPLYVLNLTTRSYNALVMNGITTVGELVNCRLSDLKKFQKLGSNSLENIIYVLEKNGFTLKSEAEN